MENRSQAGFTLYELMITLLIVGIVLTLGLPNVTSFVANSRIDATSNDLHNGFKLARSEAERANKPVTICASSNSSAATANCQGHWEDGYIVFVDHNGDLQRTDSADTIIRTFSASPDGVRFAIANDAAYFSYAATGLGRGNVNGAPAVSQIIICDERGVVETSPNYSAARLLTTTSIGHTAILKDQTLLSNAARAIGKDCF